MKHLVMAALVVMFVLSAHAATYVWSGGGGESNEWSNADNWTNIVDGSNGVPGPGDTAQFPQYSSARVALTADTTIEKLRLSDGNMMITGAYTLTLTATSEALGFQANFYGGAPVIDCNLNLPNLAAGSVTRFVNYNNELTINGDVALPETTAGFQFDVWGSGNGILTFNGQVTGFAPSQGVRNMFGNDGTFVFATQHNPIRNLMCRKGTLILKGNYDAPQGDENRVGFPSWDGNSPKKIWLMAEDGTGVYSNRFSFSVRGNASTYHEFAVKAPTINAVCLGQIRFDDKIWVFVEEGSYLKLAGGINKGDSATTHGVYLDGGGTTDIARAALTTFEVPFIVSNGVLLANNGTDGLATHGPVTVCAQGVFGGSGGVGALFTESGARLTPGNSVGTLFVSNDCTLAAGTTIDFELQGTMADLLSVGGTLDMNAGIVTARVSGVCDENTTNVLISAGTLNGAGNLVLDINTNDFISGGVVFQEGQQILVTGLVPVPEPAALLAVLAGVALAARRRK